MVTLRRRRRKAAAAAAPRAPPRRRRRRGPAEAAEAASRAAEEQAAASRGGMEGIGGRGCGVEGGGGTGGGVEGGGGTRAAARGWRRNNGQRRRGLRGPPDENKACAKEATSPVAPRSGRFFSAAGQEVHSKRMEAARKGLGEGANGPAEHTCNASGHCTGLWDNTMMYGHGSRRVVGTSPQLTCCGGIRACGCSSCRLRARCCCHRGCGRQGRGREPIRRRLMSQASLSAQKSRPEAVFSCIFISAFGGVHQHL